MLLASTPATRTAQPVPVRYLQGYVSVAERRPGRSWRAPAQLHHEVWTRNLGSSATTRHVMTDFKEKGKDTGLLNKWQGFIRRLFRAYHHGSKEVTGLRYTLRWLACGSYTFQEASS